MAQRASLAFLLLGMLFVGAIWAYPVTYLYPSLPRITRTSRGVAGDPLNVLLIGSHAQITASFSRAGWLVPDPITPATTARTIAAGLANRPYPTAPVSNLYVFGRVQDLAFEWPTSSVRQRGHVRLWVTSLHIDGQPVWLGQASYDQGIELSGTTGLPTHHIAPAVDLERDTVEADLQRTGQVVAVAEEPFTAPIFVAHNGGGDSYTSDSNILLVSVASAAIALPSVAGDAALVTYLRYRLWHAYAIVLTTLPLVVLTLGALSLLVAFALWPLLMSVRRRVGEFFDAKGALGARR
jgi:hypothetical protein